MSNRERKAKDKPAKSGKKKGSSKPKVRPISKLKARLKEERSQKVIGLLLLLISAYLFVSFVSFLFTWKIDQDLMARPWGEIFSSDVRVDNWMGKVGALISHQFIYKWFGIAAFAFPFLSFLAGVKVLANSWLLPWTRSVRWSAMGLFWLPTLLGFMFSGALFFLGGGIGFQINNFLTSMLGSFGTGALIFFAFAAFIVFTFNPSFTWFGTAFNSLKARMSKVEEDVEAVSQQVVVPVANAVRNEAQELVTEAMTDVNEVAETPSLELETAAEEEAVNEELAVEMDPVAVTPVASKEEDAEGFSVEVAEEDTRILSDKELNEKVKEFGEYDPTLDLASYQFPKIDILEDHGSNNVTVSQEELEQNKDNIVRTLSNYKIGIDKIKATIGPTVTLYEIVPQAGVRISKIKNLEDDIALSLAALGIRIIAPIPGRGTIGIEVPNSNPQTVGMKGLIASDKFQNTKMELPIALGKTISNETFITDLSKMPHLLMAGATGQGKSVGLNTILVSLLYKKHPSQVKFVLVDPKKVELTLFNKIERHFLAKLPDSEDAIITDVKKVVRTLNSLCVEMDERYELLKNAQVRNIKEYNAKFISRKLNPNNGHRFLPYIVLVVDEFADLIMTAGREVETPIARLAQLARAIGIHLIIATQRPSVNIITGTIKANFPARIAFRVTSKVDSRTILDSGGADQLIGRGDMLLSTGSDLIRLQCAFVDTPEVDEVTEFIGGQRGYPDAHLLPEVADESSEGGGPLDDGDRDVLFEDAARLVVMHQQGSTSLIQRKLKLGYNRAGRIVDQLEVAGILGPFEGSKARQVLVPDEMSLEALLNPAGVGSDVGGV